MSFRLNPTRSVFETLYPSLSERVRLSLEADLDLAPLGEVFQKSGKWLRPFRERRGEYRLRCPHGLLGNLRHGPIQDLDTYYGDTHQQASPQDPVLHY